MHSLWLRLWGDCQRNWPKDRIQTHQEASNSRESKQFDEYDTCCDPFPCHFIFGLFFCLHCVPLYIERDIDIDIYIECKTPNNRFCFQIFDSFDGEKNKVPDDLKEFLPQIRELFQHPDVTPASQCNVSLCNYFIVSKLDKLSLRRSNTERWMKRALSNFSLLRRTSMSPAFVRYVNSLSCPNF